MSAPQPTVLITGAARGIGAAVAERFRTEGWIVAGIDLSYEDSKLVDLALIGDVSLPQDFERCFQNLIDVTGRIDALINNAGLIERTHILETRPERFEEVWKVNVGGTFNGIQIAGRVMVEQHSGHIVNLSSGHAAIGGYNRAVYAATKAAIEALTRNAARELGPDGVLVNAVAPGFTITEMSRQSLVGERRAKVEKRLPIRRVAEASEVAETIFSLVSGRIPNMTGHVLRVDGGWSNSDVDYTELA